MTAGAKIFETAAFAMLRALRLLDPVLVGLAESYAVPESHWLPAALRATGLVDEERVSSDMYDMLRETDRDAVEGLFHLAEHLVFFRHGIPHAASMDVFHHVGYEIDTDLLIAARLALRCNTPVERREWIASLSWPSVLDAEGFAIEGVLWREVVDTHVHLGGALPGSFYWIAAMAGYARLYRMQHWCKADPERWIQCVQRAQGEREFLFELVRRGGSQGSSTEERGYPEHSFYPNPWSRGPDEPFCDYVLAWLLPQPELRSKYNPILGERWILWSALWCAHWKESWPGRKALSKYVARRSSFIRHLSHGPGTRGLERFQTTFRRQHLLFDDRVAVSRRDGHRERRLRAQVLGLERFRVRHSLRYQFSDPTDAPWARDQGAGLSTDPIPTSPWRPPRQVELRVTPVLGNGQLRVLHAYLLGLHDFVLHERDAPPLRVGFLFHVHRHANAHARDTAIWQFKGLLAVLQDEPGFRPFIVGIDTAGAELTVPPRDFADCYALVRSQDRAQGTHPGEPPIRLGQTCHAGEDFRDLLTGLRYVDDAIALLKLRAKDRIGHGLALAMLPSVWYDDKSFTYPLLHDHILDLLWARWLARRNDAECNLEADPQLDHRLALHLDKALTEAHGTSSRPANLDARMARILDRWDDILVFPTERILLAHINVMHGKTLWPLRVDDAWSELVSLVRQRVIRRVVRSDVVIEACPTSNLLIGGFSSYARLPYLNLNHALLPDAPTNDPRIPLSINSDDPGIFRTTVANEYRLLGSALIRLGYRRRDVAAWLEEARLVGVESTFIPKWSPPTRDELMYWLHERVFRERPI